MTEEEMIAQLEAQVLELSEQVKAKEIARLGEQRGQIEAEMAKVSPMREFGKAVSGDVGSMVLGVPAFVTGGALGGLQGAYTGPVLGGLTGGYLGYAGGDALSDLPGTAALGGAIGTITGAGFGLAAGAPTGMVSGAALAGGAGNVAGRRIGENLFKGVFGAGPNLNIPGTISVSPTLKSENPSYAEEVAYNLGGAILGLGGPALGQARQGFRGTKAFGEYMIDPKMAETVALQNPANQRAIQYAQRQTGEYFPSQMDRLPLPGRVDTALRNQVEGYQTEINTRELGTLIAQQLGASADKSFGTIGAGSLLADDAPTLIKNKFFNRFSNVDEAVRATIEPGGLLESTMKQRNQILDVVDKAREGLGAKGLVTLEDLDPLVTSLREKISYYKTLSKTTPKADALDSELATFLGDVRALSQKTGGLGPKQVNTVNELFNDYRRTILEEFVPQQVGKEVQGQSIGVAAKEGSLLAVKEIQNFLRGKLIKSIDETVAERPGLATNFFISGKTFADLNEYWGALKSFAQSGTRFLQETMRGSPLTERSAANLVQTKGKGAFVSNAGRGAPGLAGELVNRARGGAGFSEQDAQTTLASTSLQRAWKNIQDIISLKADPADLGPIPGRPSFFQNPGYTMNPKTGPIGVPEYLTAYGLGRGMALGAETQEAMAQEEVFTPKAPVKVSLNPMLPEPKEGFQLPRNLTFMDPQGVSNMIGVMMPPQVAEPLLLQWRKVSQGGTKEQQAEFLGLLVDRYPDFPIQRGPITGLNSEFDIGDGQMRLFGFSDKVKWEEQVNNSSLETDEKAQRILSLRKSGVVVPMDVRLSPESASMTPIKGQSKAMDYLMQTYQFQPREITQNGSRRVE